MLVARATKKKNKNPRPKSLTGANGLSALAKREAQSGLNRKVVRNRVTGHDHPFLAVFRVFGNCNSAGDISGAQKHLRAVVAREGRVAAALLLGEDVDLRLELLQRFHRPGRRENHAPANLLPLNTAEQGAHVIAGLSPVEFPMEHLEASNYGLDIGAHAENFDLLVLGNRTAVHAAGNHGATPRDRKDVCRGNTGGAGRRDRGGRHGTFD
ncbi:MAG: hypothetical protein BJ554DRAFT_5791 [Olpidium bornovanus]|uniref:Uncharacterized protein n=1 Tax=Olpidium bornovanus TaxID=278681 RepID=A0A8H8DMD9_9FUNG|nr:MAG: hypothetical protein BJ554DRAFT_5791 [Olpidium bornovanus]